MSAADDILAPGTGNPRMHGLHPADVANLHAAARAIRDRQPKQAEQLLRTVRHTAPGHPEPLRLLGILYTRYGRSDLAVSLLRDAVRDHPRDGMLRNDLANAAAAGGDIESALEHWRAACELAADDATPWFNLGRNLQQLGRTEEAVQALLRACELAPEQAPARLLLADALVHGGQLAEAATHYRRVLLHQPASGDAWRGLSNIKTAPLTEADLGQLQGLVNDHAVAVTDRIGIGHALGKLQEDRGDYRNAFASFSAANAQNAARAPWDSTGFRHWLRAALRVTAELPDPIEPTLGSEVIFIVGAPRSGSTMFEQILAAHPQVEGASELPDLGMVLQRESRRRGQRFPDWVTAATADDWHRLGREYLDATGWWRRSRPVHTDKLPENWQFAGILRAMLPGACVLHTHRDPLETGWSCFKQLFYRNPHFSCDLGDIALWLRGCEYAMEQWRQRAPAQIHDCSYETLLQQPDAQIRSLLERCKLPFDPACLQPHLASRNVRTASAAQVRQPLHAPASRASAYGTLLAPLSVTLEAPLSLS